MPGEALPDHWPVHGTTGYEFLNALNGLFVDPKGARALEQTYQRITGLTAPFADVVHQAKRLITDTTMASELNVLGRRLARLAERAPRVPRLHGAEPHRGAARDRRVLSRSTGPTSATTGATASSEQDRAPRGARPWRKPSAAAPTTNPSVFEFIGDLLCRTGELDFVRRFQQLTGPVTAKGVEDTAFYRYTPARSP